MEGKSLTLFLIDRKRYLMYRVIINPSVAKKLLEKGNLIVDIKPNKDIANATRRE